LRHNLVKDILLFLFKKKKNSINYLKLYIYIKYNGKKLKKSNLLEIINMFLNIKININRK
jgi:hypothetical protein